MLYLLWLSVDDNDEADNDEADNEAVDNVFVELLEEKCLQVLLFFKLDTLLNDSRDLTLHRLPEISMFALVDHCD